MIWYLLNYIIVKMLIKLLITEFKSIIQKTENMEFKNK